jgi:CheY-like chemotaxis protein
MGDTAEMRQPRRKMLIADDDPAILRLLADRCGKLVFQVETAMNGAQLLVKVRNNHPNILIVDVKMPLLDGLSVCTRLLEPGRKSLEVVVVTGSSDPETPERCESLGTFFGRKGPDFWKSIEGALSEIYPDLACKMEGAPLTPPDTAVPLRPRVLVVDDDPDIGVFFPAGSSSTASIRSMRATPPGPAHRRPGKAERHYLRQSDAGRRRAVPVASLAGERRHRGHPGIRHQRPQARRPDRADAQARDRPATRRHGHLPQILRHRGTFHGVAEILRLRGTPRRARG